MPILSASALGKHYGERVILDGVGLALEAGERAGLVGPNGGGKSTLARILAGLEEPDQGEVVRGRGIRMAYLEQEPRMDPGATAMEVVLAGLGDWSRAVARHHELSAAITASKGDLTELLAAQAKVAAEVERLGGWDRSHQASAVLDHLGVLHKEQRVGPMSGGERRRVALARLLVASPDVAILDEPTNHLDIPTIEWLESYLCDRFRGALLLITHDRYLLDRVVTRTFELDRGTLHAYEGGWEEFLTARAEREAQAERIEANRKKFLSRELEWLRRQPKARTTKQKARTDRAEAALDSAPVRRAGTARLRVQGVRAGHTVLDLEDLAVDVAGRRLFEGLRLSLAKGERVGVVGRNGCGKTSLMRVILGELAPAAGTMRLGKNTRVAYLDQQRSGLDDSETVLESVGAGRSHVRLGDHEVSVHAYLERFLFSSSAQTQKVGTLSGGERARVALARILRDQANLVILDEPTNDLDVTTLSALEEALLDFGGTVLVVTHDRWFLDRVATSILGFEPDPEGGAGEPGRAQVVHVHGNYQSYCDYRQAEERERQAAERQAAEHQRQIRPAQPVARAPEPAMRSRGLTYGERLELEGLLERVAAAETAVAELEVELESPAFYERDHKEQAAFLDRLALTKAEAEALIERWADLESRNQPS